MLLAIPTRPAALAWALSLLAAGCGGEPGHVPLFPTTGSVVVDGLGVAGVHVRLAPAGSPQDVDALKPTAISGEGGEFRLGTFARGDGAPEGRYRVTLYFPSRPPNGSNAPDDLLGGRFLDPAKSTIEVTVGPSENRLGPFRVAKATGPAPGPRPSRPSHDGVD